MSKKHDKGKARAEDGATLRRRVDHAVREGRFQQALELARQLVKQEPTPDHRNLLRTAALGRARQLRAAGQTRDAATTLQAVLAVEGATPEWLATAAQELAGCGEVGAALQVMERLPGSPLLPKVLGQAADAAVAQGAAGKAKLPANLHADFDRTLAASGHVEAGRDEPAKEALQGISLTSPFLEWKLYLRGLQAYYTNDDARAVENWQRLQPDRLPARLAAPFRADIDPAFRQAQKPEALTALAQARERLAGSLPLDYLRRIQAMAASPGRLSQAFPLARDVLPLLEKDAPHLAPRLRLALYWAIITSGEPHDRDQYRRQLGAPADDPNFERLEAMALERCRDFFLAHQSWHRYQQTLANLAGPWPGPHKDRARALVLNRMGRHAANAPDTSEILEQLPFHLRDMMPERPPEYQPSAEQCFRQAAELAPDLLEPYDELFRYLLDTNKKAKAVAAGKKLLERFPDHLPTLTALAQLHLEQGHPAEALALRQRALKLNPLDRGLRQAVGTAHLFVARDHAEAGRFDAARQEFQAALRLNEQAGAYAVYCKWAACEFKAGDAARGEELLGQALADAGNRLAVAFSMVIEVIRLKLPAKLKTRFNKAFNEALAEPPTPAGALAIAVTAADHRAAGVTYHGQKTHEKKVLTYLTAVLGQAPAAFTAADLRRIGAALALLEGASRVFRAVHDLGRERFPNDPWFPYLAAEAELRKGPDRARAWEVGRLLEDAEARGRRLPAGPEQEKLLRLIAEARDKLDVLNPFQRAFEQMFMGGAEEEFEDGPEEDRFW